MIGELMFLTPMTATRIQVAGAMGKIDEAWASETGPADPLHGSGSCFDTEVALNGPTGRF